MDVLTIVQAAGLALSSAILLTVAIAMYYCVVREFRHPLIADEAESMLARCVLTLMASGAVVGAVAASAHLYHMVS